jgi:azurin
MEVQMKIFSCLIAVLVMAGCSSSPDLTVEIETLGNQMKYNVVKIKAKKNSTLLIKFKNNATLPVMKHNIIVLNSEDAIDAVGTAALSAENNIPDHPSIIASSSMVGPGESTELLINIPDQPGVYPYICTYPGHYQVMQGKIIVE